MAVIQFATTLALGAFLAVSARADVDINPAVPGGIQTSPEIVGSPVIVGSNATLNYKGLQAPYMIQVSSNGVDWQNAGVSALKKPNFSGTCLATNIPAGAGFFRLMMLGSTNWVGKWNPGALAISNVFVGANKCNGCHGQTVAEWSGTAHATAVDAILNPDGSFKPFRNASCLNCHVVGKDQPGGFTSLSATPQLANVQCENCHGSANAHVNISGRTYNPVNTLDPKLCGTCHTDNHHPTYDEYETTGHAEVLGDISYGTATPGIYYSDMLVIKGVNTNTGSLNIVAPGTPGSTNCYGYLVTTNADLSLRTNFTTGILHSGNGPGSGYVPGYDPGWDRAVGCGICHSAAARHAMLKDFDLRKTGYTNAIAFPPAHESAEWTATCVTCHNPHSSENVAQLRNPINSATYYTMPTTADKRTTFTTNAFVTWTTNGVVTNLTTTTNIFFMSAAFANMYDPAVNICGQCHNSRGARWDGRSFGYYRSNTLQTVTVPGSNVVWGVQTNFSYQRPPHHSPQYNILSGIVQPDYLNGTNAVTHPHGTNPKGCAACHMTPRTVATPTDQNPNYTGHQFEPLLSDFASCTGCHTEGATVVSNQMASLQSEISGSIALLVGQLNNWAILKGTNLFGALNATRYKENGWEYTTPGGLATVTNAGPSSADQVKIPAGIRQARFDLYMAGYGNAASLGIHNPAYTRYLLNDASNKVAAAIAAP